jgi:hypothetical protein
MRYENAESDLASPHTNDNLSSLNISRRALLGGTAFALGSLALHAPAMAQTASAPTPEQFLALSKRATDRAELSEVTSKRILDALGEDASTAGGLVALVGMMNGAKSAADLKAAAVAGGQDKTLTAVISAWYTGTITTAKGPVVVAYKDALMYQSTADGLVVPTYCNKGPMWWRNTLPPDVTRTPINKPEVL